MIVFRQAPRRSLLIVALVAGAISLPATDGGIRKVEASTGISIEFVGRANSTSGLGGSEISAYDPTTKRLFVTNGATNKIDIFDIANPAAPVLVKSVDLSSLGVTGVQSVASRGGRVAAAASVGGDNQAAGKIFIMDADGNMDSRAPLGVTVGSLPDSVHFTPDGTKVLTANEGEPKNYCSGGSTLSTTLDPYGSVSIVDLTAQSLTATTVNFEPLNSSAEAIRAAGGRVYGPGSSVAQDLEPEYIAISDDSRTAFVTLQENNAVAEIDLKYGLITRVMGLGYKDHSVTDMGIDASDQDSAVNIANWPVKGMYQPDNIATFTGSDGVQYFVTANEGDAREYPCLLGGTSTTSAQAEDARVGSVGVDGTSLASTLSSNSNLGRLSVTRFLPATYTNNGNEKTAVGSTDFTSLYVLGARSITVWKRPAGTGVTSAQLVADTGNVIETQIAAQVPNYFNADWNTSSGTPNAKDSRSDNKGPEPEGIAVGSVFGSRYAFVGLERIGGVMAFDITDPAAPKYAAYVNTSVFTATGGANFATAGAPTGDVSPEGVLFIRATDSPTGVPLLVVSNELSGTTAIYKIVGAPVAPSAPRSVSATAARTSLEVSWSAPEDDGGVAITSYVAQASPGGKSCTTTGLSCVIAGLTPGTAYTVSVKATNATATGVATRAQSQVVTAILTAASGKSIATTGMSKRIAVRSALAVKSRKFTVGLTRASRVTEYTFTVVDTSGKKLATVTAPAGSAHHQMTLSSPSAGRVRVVVTATVAGGAKVSWSSPVISIK